MSTLHHESIMEQCHDEAWESFRKHNKLTEDQLNECLDIITSTLVEFESQ